MKILGHIKGVDVFSLKSLIFWSKSARPFRYFLLFISINQPSPICDLNFQQIIENQENNTHKKRMLISIEQLYLQNNLRSKRYS